MLKIIVVSDASGETAERVVRSALTQFGDVAVSVVRCGGVRTPEQVRSVVAEAALRDSLIVHTLVSDTLRKTMLQEARIHAVDAMDLMGPALDRLAFHLGVSPQEKPGLFSQLTEAASRRIEAVEFAFRHDDGQRVEELEGAEIVLVGVSRTMKTPTTLYLAAFTTMPADDGTGGVEVTLGQGAYARIKIDNNTTNFPAAVAANPSVSSLNVSFSFPTATADWSSGAPIVGYGLYDAPSGGVYQGAAYALTAIGIADVSTVDGTFTFTAPHGRIVNDGMGMFISAGPSSALPSGFGPFNTNKYYVIAPLTANTLRLSATQGGAAIVPLTVGVGALFVGQSYVQPVFNNQTLTFPIGALQFSTTSR